MNRPSHDARPSRQRRHHRRDTTGREDDPTMSLRVVSYNILADQYSSRDVDKKDDADRMYSHCKYEYLTKWRRHPLIVHEILAYQPDVVALQEVDADVFAYLLKPVLTAKGYEGYFSPKGGGAYPGVGEGCAIFWSLEVFDSVRPVDMRTRTFREMFQEFSCEEHINTHTSQWKSLKDMSKLLEKHHELKHVLFNKLGHVMQTVVLTQRQSQEKLVIGNTHLFYHPMASHIRCLKMLIASRQLEIEHRENQYCPIILCGDLNSHPQSGVMKLLLDRYLNANNGQTWKHLCTFDWEETQGTGVRRDVEAIDLELPPSFPKFLSGYPTPPDFTHYIEAFICTLDYILVTNNFEVEKAGATPTRDDVRKFIAMPNECMPSDHVSLVCDLVWR
jgi:2',5'-phosphodiesterase